MIISGRPFPALRVTHAPFRPLLSLPRFRRATVDGDSMDKMACTDQG